MLTGRDTELQRLLAAISRDRSAAVLGPSGVGKTALAAALVATLDPARYLVVRAVGTEASRSVPFGALAELVMDGADPPDKAFLMGRIVRETARRAGTRAAVLVVDDAHLLDGPSAGAILALAARRRARAVVTIRAGEPTPDAIRALWKDHGADRIELGPFDRAGTELLLAELLGGVVAGPTVDLLHQWTGGNPLFLTELVRAGRSDDRLRLQAGIWWWQSDLTVPARLAELLDRRVDGLQSDERDAVAAVALGEPLAIELLDAVGSAEVTARLEDLAVIRTEETAGGVTARLDHPLLSAAVRRRLSPARRRRIAARLLAAHRDARAGLAGPVRRAVWQLEAHADVDVDLLLGAAETIMHTDPALAERLARRADATHRSVRSATALAHALVETGDAAAARSVLDAARTTARTPEEAAALAVALAGYRAWIEREPGSAHDELVALRASAPGARAEIDSVDALVLLFSGRTTEALARADALAAAGASRRAVVRSRLVQAIGWTLVGRTGRALAAAEGIVRAPAADLAALPHARGMAVVARALAQLWRTPLGAVPRTDPARGHWPAGDPGETLGLEPTAWPLFDGYVSRVVGDNERAIRRLREALVQQSGGEGLFRSEAAAWLALSLAEAGRVAEADAVLDRDAPDAVAIVPGLLPWARAGVAAARGQRAVAARHMQAAIGAARDAGCWLVELGYLNYLATDVLDGRADDALAARVEAAIAHVDAPRLLASAQATLALLRPDPGGLLDHARNLRSYGLTLAAVRLADEAGKAAAPEARRFAAELREELGLAEPDGTAGLLTRREAEVAALARHGMTDREIAEHLVLSVRTVETHLTRVYRKLGITSRRQLAPQ